MYENHGYCHVEIPEEIKIKKEFNTDKNDGNAFKLYHKVRDGCQYSKNYRGAAHNICNLRHQIPKEIPVSFHNVSTYDYHFIIKKLAKEFESQIECVGENIEKYMSFSVQVIQKLMVRMVKELHTK